MSIQSINPATGDVLETFAPTSAPELERILARAHEAYLGSCGVPFASAPVACAPCAGLAHSESSVCPGS